MRSVNPHQTSAAEEYDSLVQELHCYIIAHLKCAAKDKLSLFLMCSPYLDSLKFLTQLKLSAIK